jgi:hypothetical protein
LGFDIAGTGESTIPLSIKGDELVLGIVNEARKLGNGKSRISDFRSAATSPQ